MQKIPCGNHRRHDQQHTAKSAGADALRAHTALTDPASSHSSLPAESKQKAYVFLSCEPTAKTPPPADTTAGGFASFGGATAYVESIPYLTGEACAMPSAKIR